MTDKIVTRDIGRSTWQGPESEAPRKGKGMTNYNDGKWYGWNGGKYPVAIKSRGDITYADGVRFRDVILSDMVWDEPLMFRVTKEHKEPREFWAKEMLLHNLKTGLTIPNGWGECSKSDNGAVLFREVLE